MSSPAEAHAEYLADERMRNRARTVRRQLDHLHGMISDVGFGMPCANLWTEREIERHLTAAYELLHHELRAFPSVEGA